MTLTPAQIEFDDQGRLISTLYGDIYFQPAESLNESEYVFLQQSGFYSHTDDITIAELGFGTGLNFMLAASRKPNDEKWLHYISFEKHPILARDLQNIHTYWPELDDISRKLLLDYPIMTQGIHKISLPERKTTLTLVFGDVHDFLPNMDFKADIWFLDGFAPAKNPDMWAETLWQQMARNSHQGAQISTFTAAGFVKRGLENAGFTVQKTKGYGRKREMLIGTLHNTPAATHTFTAKNIPIPPARQPQSVAVIGAGIAGCALAAALKRYGHDITLIDAHDRPAQGASGNARAAIYPKIGGTNTAADQIYRAAFCYSQAFYTALGHYDPCGVFLMNHNEQAKSRHLKIATRGLSRDLAVYKDRDDVTGLNLGCGGLYIPKGGTISPPAICSALIDGIKTLFSTPIKNIEKQDEQWVLNRTIIADAVIIADNTQINQTVFTDWIPSEIVSGQMSTWAGNTISHKLKTVICHSGYITPLYESAHIFGATFDKGQTDTSAPTDADHQRNFTQLFSALPLLQSSLMDETSISGRKSNRTATPDRLPLMGAVINHDRFREDFAALSQDASTAFDTPPLYHDGLYVLGALGSHGMTTGPWLAEYLAAQLSGQPLPMTRNLYNALSPTRFAFRNLKRKALPNV